MIRPHRRGAMSVALGLGGYGVVVAAAGMVAAMSVTPAPAPPTLAAGTLGRPLVPVTPVGPAIGAAAGQPGSPSAGPSLPVPVAAVAGTAPGQASPWRPLSVVLPTGRTAPVVDSGVHADGSLAIPVSPSVVGWWTGGARVGDPFGGIVLAGHVDSAALGIGVLADLRSARQGQVIVLRNGARVARYRIVSVSTVPQSLLVSGTDAFRQDVAPRLVMVTCGGPFNRATHSYLDNLVVIASPVVTGS